MVGASEASAPIVVEAISRCLPGNNTNAVVNTVGIIAAPSAPCRPRNRIIELMSHARPHSMLVIVKPREENANSQRVEKTRVSQPDIGITMISAIRYEVCTHESSSWLAARPPPISRSEDATIWISSVAMKKPRHISANANALVRVGWSAGFKGWVMVGRSQTDVDARAEPRDSALRSRMRRRAAAAADMNLHRRGQAGAQHAQHVWRHIEVYPHRHALHDLREVAGCVFCGQDAKGRACSRRQTVDHAVQRLAGSVE